MKIPKKVKKNGRNYTFTKVCKDNMYLYQDDQIKTTTTFTNFDLGLIDNSKIDKEIQIAEIREGFKYIVYDRLSETEKEWTNLRELSKVLHVGRRSIVNAINKRQWVGNRYFVERIEK